MDSTTPGSWGWTSDAYIGNYGDNSLLYFTQYQNANPGNPLYDTRARRDEREGGPGPVRDPACGRAAQQTARRVVDRRARGLHRAPELAGQLRRLVRRTRPRRAHRPTRTCGARPRCSLTYDENDGFFDHMVPAYAPMTAADGASTVDTSLEIYHGTSGTAGGTPGQPGPYGLGQRVPMLVVSPWSKGGYVSSEVFDHTSMIRFIEKRFGVARAEHLPVAACGHAAT